MRAKAGIQPSLIARLGARHRRKHEGAQESESADLGWESCVSRTQSYQFRRSPEGNTSLRLRAYVRLRTKLVVTEYQQADSGPHEPGNPGNVG